MSNTQKKQRIANCNVSSTADDKETAILITTGLMSSAPSIQMIKEVIASYNMLIGLSVNAPIYITLDYPPPP